MSVSGGDVFYGSDDVTAPRRHWCAEVPVPIWPKMKAIRLKPIRVQIIESLGHDHERIIRVVNNKITLGVQSGNPEASDAMRPVFFPLRGILYNYCSDIYCHEIKEFSILLRVNGSISKFEGEGVQKIRINRKGSYITADFVIPEEKWNGVDISKINSYLSSGILDVINKMCCHLDSLKIEIDKLKIKRDINIAISKFLEK